MGRTDCRSARRGAAWRPRERSLGGRGGSASGVDSRVCLFRPTAWRARSKSLEELEGLETAGASAGLHGLTAYPAQAASRRASRRAPRGGGTRLILCENYA